MARTKQAARKTAPATDVRFWTEADLAGKTINELKKIVNALFHDYNSAEKGNTIPVLKAKLIGTEWKSAAEIEAGHYERSRKQKSVTARRHREKLEDAGIDRKKGETFKSVNPNQVEDDDQLAMYFQFKELIEGQRDWTELTEHLKRKQVDFDKLQDFQKERFFVLSRKLINQVETEILPENFAGEVHGIWNIKIWLSVLIKLAAIKRPIANENDCVYHESCLDGASKKDSNRIRINFGFDLPSPKLHVYSCFLNIGQSLEKLEISHRCGRAMCINELHLTNESREDNWRREKCEIQCIQMCPCQPVCVHQLDGVFNTCKFHPNGCLKRQDQHKVFISEEQLKQMNELSAGNFTISTFGGKLLIEAVEKHDFVDEPQKRQLKCKHSPERADLSI